MKRYAGWTRAGGIGLAFMAVMTAAGAMAADYHVDPARQSPGDGLSWATAWPDFAAIDWQKLGPGDTLLLSGGPTGRVYRATLSVGASGAEGRPLTIRPAETPGHAGPVAIDAGNIRASGIVIEDRDHVVVQGLAVRNVDDAGVRIRRARAGVVVEDVTVEAGNPWGQGNARGFDVRESRGVVLRRNRYGTPRWSLAQNDGIFSMANDGVRFEKNRIVIENNYEGPDEGHNDCIQSWQDVTIEIVGNHCWQRHNKRGHSLGLFVQNISGTALVLNNVVVSPNTNSACIAVENLPDFAAPGRMLAYHNSAYGCAYGTLHIVRSPDSVAYNNILVSPGAKAQAMKVVPPAPPPGRIDHNLLFTPASPHPVFIGGEGPLGWAAWRARGHEAHGLYGDPGFLDPEAGDLRLAPGSIARGRGRRLEVPAPDRAGDRRRLDPGFADRRPDLGAFAPRPAAASREGRRLPVPPSSPARVE